MAWELYSIAANPHVQTKLREELLSIRTDTPTKDVLHALPYLDSVVRESLRLYSPVAFSTRMAFEDDVLPLSTPYVDKQGREYHGLPCVSFDELQPSFHVLNLSVILTGCRRGSECTFRSRPSTRIRVFGEKMQWSSSEASHPHNHMFF
jgi:hypothetical protein